MVTPACRRADPVAVEAGDQRADVRCRHQRHIGQCEQHAARARSLRRGGAKRNRTGLGCAGRVEAECGCSRVLARSGTSGPVTEKRWVKGSAASMAAAWSASGLPLSGAISFGTAEARSRPPARSTSASPAKPAAKSSLAAGADIRGPWGVASPAGHARAGLIVLHQFAKN